MSRNSPFFLMAILPVLDILNGAVVRGVGGRRENYRPIVSRWTTSARPIDVARALASHFRFNAFYLADLDAIVGRAPSVAIYAALKREGFELWVDAGIRTPADAAVLTATNVATLVAGMETIAGPDVLQALVAELGSERVVLSLDLKGGERSAIKAAGRARSRSRLRGRLWTGESGGC